MRVLYAFGTRPEFIRSATLLRELMRLPTVDVLTVNTGQHYDYNMAGGFLEELNLPDVQESIGVGELPRHEQVGQISSALGRLVQLYEPSCVCVFGDTNSTLGAAIGAVTAGCPVVHVEAGARSFDLSMPEEMNRRIVDHCADLLLAVSARCAANLRRERVPGHIAEVGDPLYEVFLTEWSRFHGDSAAWSDRHPKSCLLTLHRQALLDDAHQLRRVLDSVSDFATENSVEIIFPIHPHTARVLAEHRIALGPSITARGPLLYRETIELLWRSSLVITDSGGLQKEAFWAGRPCVTVRPNTEWTETISARANLLAEGADVGSGARKMLHRRLREADGESDPYHGLGSSERIAAAIIGRYSR